MIIDANRVFNAKTVLDYETAELKKPTSTMMQSYTVQNAKEELIAAIKLTRICAYGENI